MGNNCNLGSLICFFVILTLAADAIERGLDIVVGTPGRLMDHVVNGSLNLRELR